MKTIALTRGQVALVSDCDYAWLNQWKWCANWNTYTRSYYAMRRQYIGRIEGREIFVGLGMHREILRLGYGDGRKSDHRNHDTLNNQRHNLRIATSSQNVWNSGKRRNNTSGFKGVTYHPKTGKWQASIVRFRKRTYLGLRATPKSAHKLYCVAARTFHGEFARIK